MRATAAFSRLRARLAAFHAANAGIAAVEFAMILPVMVLMYLGMTEMTFGVNVDRKITFLSRTLADLTGRARTVTSTSMNDVFTAAYAVMQPYRSEGTKMTISSIAVIDTGQTQGSPPKPILQGKVCWSEARIAGATTLATTTALPANSVVPVPEGFQTANTSFVRADVELPYAPVFGAAILSMITGKGTTSINLNEATPWPVRNVPEVIMQGVQPCLK